MKRRLLFFRRFNCRLAEIPSTPFDIIDRENVLLKMQNPVNPIELFAVVNIRDTKLAEELRKKFAAIWEKAEGCMRGEGVEKGVGGVYVTDRREL